MWFCSETASKQGGWRQLVIGGGHNYAWYLACLFIAQQFSIPKDSKLFQCGRLDAAASQAETACVNKGIRKSRADSRVAVPALNDTKRER